MLNEIFDIYRKTPKTVIDAIYANFPEILPQKIIVKFNILIYNKRTPLQEVFYLVTRVYYDT